MSFGCDAVIRLRQGLGETNPPPFGGDMAPKQVIVRRFIHRQDHGLLQRRENVRFFGMDPTQGRCFSRTMTIPRVDAVMKRRGC